MTTSSDDEWDTCNVFSEFDQDRSNAAYVCRSCETTFRELDKGCSSVKKLCPKCNNEGLVKSMAVFFPNSTHPHGTLLHNDLVLCDDITTYR